MMMLAIPQLGTKEGKGLIVSLAILVIMKGPLANVNTNMEQVQESLTCHAELSYNQSR